MRIAYLGNFPFPGSTAATHRVRGVAQALTLAGHQVTIVPLLRGDGSPGDELTVEASVSRSPAPGSISNAASLLLGGGEAVDWLRQSGRDHDAVLVYGTPAALLLRYNLASRFGRGELPPIVLDVVEWYDYASRPGGRLGPFAAEHAAAMNFIAPRAAAAICISTFLADYFDHHGCPTAVVPPLFDHPRAGVEGPRSDPTRMSVGYAGTPGAKDGLGLVNLMVSAASLPAGMRSRLDLQFVGLSESEGAALVRRHLPSADPALWESARWHGRVTSAEAQQLVASWDMTYLQRPRLRYAMAGFPTKVVESLMLGTPVMTNATSDLATYINDGRNGVLLGQDGSDGSGLAAVRASLARVLAPDFRIEMSREQIQADTVGIFHPARFAAPLDRLIRTALAR